MRKKIAAFAKKYWYLLLFGLAILALFLRRAAVLHRLSQLRQRLTTQERRYDQLVYEKKRATIIDDVREQELRIKEQQRQIQATETAIAAATKEHSEVLRVIDTAKTWEDLERLRQEGNAR